MTGRHAFRLIDALASIAILWAVMAVVPAHWFWFDPGRVIVGDSDGTKPPSVSFEREIKRDVRMRYQVVIRKIGGAAVCDPASAAFTYRKDAELPDDVDLVWWTGGDKRCWPREPGTYLMETCWTVVSPFWGLVPPKLICRESAPFRVGG